MIKMEPLDVTDVPPVKKNPRGKVRVKKVFIII